MDRMLDWWQLCRGRLDFTIQRDGNLIWKEKFVLAALTIGSITLYKLRAVIITTILKLCVSPGHVN